MERQCGIVSNQSITIASIVGVRTANATTLNTRVPNGVIMGAETVNANEVRYVSHKKGKLFIPATSQSDEELFCRINIPLKIGTIRGV